MIIVGNFKSYIPSKEDAEVVAKTAAKLKTKHKIVLAPSFTHLGFLSGKKLGVTLAAQDLSLFEGGAHTGEVSGDVIANTGAEYVIVGHSERRADGDTNSIVATKVCQTLSSKLKVILCIGEQDRDGHATYLSFITEEIVSALKAVKEVDFKNIVIAYEPIWAIGKKAEEAITADDLEEMVLYIKKVLHEHFGEKVAKTIKVLYGGSVDAQNIQSLVVPGLDGFLVGRASASKESLTALIDALDA